ncbi:hypothetical protein AALO_G00283630 [Alosa alosa]|uniref:Uncharacterized protein n=1 Tax=Alosa alosa TaxID=278164 RepID=A0AAV6FJZ6_9TELE|nr:hypothetical protein AALO_G00283630 [Alosa alosa]
MPATAGLTSVSATESNYVIMKSIERTRSVTKRTTTKTLGYMTPNNKTTIIRSTSLFEGHTTSLAFRELVHDALCRPMSISFALSFSMDNMASPLSLSCPTVLLKWFLMIFNLENERSEVATVTGRVKNKIRAVQISLNAEVTAGWLHWRSEGVASGAQAPNLFLKAPNIFLYVFSISNDSNF